jgi:hypothetical protein
MPLGLEQALHENTGFRPHKPGVKALVILAFGICHYGKVYEPNGAETFEEQGIRKGY